MNASNGFMPMFQEMMPVMPILPVMPVMPFAQNDNGASGEDAASNMKKFWEQMIDVQKTSMNTAKDQWTRFFEYMMDMQDTFAESLPDELPTLPGFPQPAVSPKEFMRRTPLRTLPSRGRKRSAMWSTRRWRTPRRQRNNLPGPAKRRLEKPRDL